MYRNFGTYGVEGDATPLDQNARLHGEIVAPRWRNRLRPLLRKPLTHFIILGVLIFAAAHWLETRSQR